MFNSRRRRRGFTLPEVLVTIAIVAVLAAAVVPTVINQIGKGEGAAVAADFNALTAAVTQFITDTRQYPDRLAHLNGAITTDSVDLLDADYTARAVAQWGGPYLAANGGDTLTTFTFSGFGFVAANDLLGPSGQDGFITLDLDETGLSLAKIIAADVALDGGDGVFDPDCPSASTGSTTGRLRWTEGANTPCNITNLVYRLVPTGG